MAQVAPGFLEQRLIEVSDLVRHDLREVLDALARDDSAVAQRVIEADDEIDRLCLALDRDAEILLVGNVVPARDIALVLASTRIARDLERMADQCVTIAKLVQMGGNDGPQASAVRGSLEEWAGAASACSRPRPTHSRGAMQRARSSSTSSTTWSTTSPLRRRAGARPRGRSRTPRLGLRMVLVARALERIADNAVDIAEQASYVVTGELREFSDASHPDETPGEAA